MWLILGFLALLVGLIVVSESKRRKFPGPKTLPLLGNAVELIKNEARLLDYMTDLHRIHGQSFRLYLPGQPNFVFTSNTKNIEYVLSTNFSNYVKGPKFHHTSRDLLGDGIFAVDGELWKTQRKVASNLFTIRIFKDVMQPVFHHHMKTFNQIIQNSISDQESLDAQTLFYRFALDSIGEIAFGINIGSLESFLVKAKDGPAEKFGKAFDSSQEVIRDRFLSVVPLELRKLLHPAEARFRADVKYLNTWSYSVIKARRADPNTQNKEDILSFFLNSKKGDKTEGDFSDEFLRDILLNFMVAGRDTTAQLLTWFFYLISLPENKEKLDKIYHEVDEVLGKTSDSQIVAGFENVKKLKYLEAALTETLRLYPPVPKELKMVVKDDVLPDGTEVQAGEWVAFTPYCMGRLSSLWEDPLSYNPERFMKKQAVSDITNTKNEGEEGERGSEEDTRAKGHPFKFVSFLAGPRMCLGQNMAYYEAKVVAGEILRRFRFSLAPNQKITYANQLTLPTKNGVLLRFEKR